MKPFLKKILLVDDDPRDVILMTSALKETHLGNEIIVAEDGEEAIDFLFRRGRFEDYIEELPVFILLDIKMPMMDGIEVLKLIRSEKSFDTIPVIMMTSSKDSQDLNECYKLGANSFVVKPLNINDFVKVVKDIGKYWVIINEIPS